jgi:hypothetical protein
LELVTYDWEISLTLTSGDPVPPGGGLVGYDAELVSNESDPSAGDCWIDLVMPTGDLYTLLNHSLELSPFANIQRSLTLNVPASAPSGTYTMYGRCGVFPGIVWDEASFTFQKQADGEGIFDPTQLTVSGWDSEEHTTGSKELPTDFNLMSVYPNPFNPTTSISFTLPAADNVTLTVHDVLGREVARLADGCYQQGCHRATFSGDGLPSGVYFVNLAVGKRTLTEKMLLLK